ncbi:MAG TPA: OsmC family peroxiredoxin [Gemmatimonadales bacterium]|jgi:osmotically inducible protein OsmC
MIEHRARARWRGDLKHGAGSFQSSSSAGRYSFSSRFEEAPGSTPEELIGAAHASCFAMALALFLGRQGHRPVAIDTAATVHLDPQKLAIARIELDADAEVPGLSDSAFQECAELAKENCPVSKALSGVEILLRSARLKHAARERA